MVVGDCPACDLRQKGLQDYLENKQQVMNSLDEKTRAENIN